MKTLRGSMILIATAWLAVACGGGGGGDDDRTPPPSSHFRCFRPSTLPRTETGKISCFQDGGCIATLITSMSTPPSGTGYAARPWLTSALRFMTVSSNGFTNVAVPRGLNHDISLTLGPGFDTPTGVQGVLVEAVMGNSVSTLLDVTLVPNSNLCP